MRCDEGLLRRNTTPTTAVITPKTMTMSNNNNNNNASTRSLLVDYSKQRAPPEELKEAEILLPNTIHVGYDVPGALSSSKRYSSRRSSAGMRAQDRINNNSCSSFQDESESSFGLPELRPMSLHGSSVHNHHNPPNNSLTKAMKFLGASADTIEMEGDDSFACEEAVMVSPAAAPMTLRRSAAPGNRRAGNRRTNSLSQLKENLPSEGDSFHEDNSESLRFSLRRRASQTNRNSNGDANKPSLGRSKTWDPSAQQQQPQEDGGRSWGAMFEGIDASQHSVGSGSPKGITPENRRRMLVRHSSVSALEQSTRPFGAMGRMGAMMDMSMPVHSHRGSTSTSRGGMVRQSSLRGGMRKQSSLRGVLAAPRSPKRGDEPIVLPDTIEIKPKDEKDKDKTKKKKKKQISLDNHFRRHSMSNGDKKTGGSSIASRSAFTNALGRTSLHGLLQNQDDHMSVSDKSHFTTLTGRCPTTRAVPNRQFNNSVGSRRDMVLRRSLSARRHLGAKNDLEDTSQFVTGSRIRRCSGAELLGC